MLVATDIPRKVIVYEIIVLVDNANRAPDEGPLLGHTVNDVVNVPVIKVNSIIYDSALHYLKI
jgi:hypothetical protein